MFEVAAQKLEVLNDGPVQTASELEGHLLEKHRKFQPIKVYETCDQCGIELKNAKEKERHIRKHLTEEFDCSQLWRCRADSDCERVCESAKSLFKNISPYKFNNC